MTLCPGPDGVTVREYLCAVFSLGAMYIWHLQFFYASLDPPPHVTVTPTQLISTPICIWGTPLLVMTSYVHAPFEESYWCVWVITCSHSVVGVEST